MQTVYRACGKAAKIGGKLLVNEDCCPLCPCDTPPVGGCCPGWPTTNELGLWAEYGDINGDMGNVPVVPPGPGEVMAWEVTRDYGIGCAFVFVQLRFRFWCPVGGTSFEDVQGECEQLATSDPSCGAYYMADFVPEKCGNFQARGTLLQNPPYSGSCFNCLGIGLLVTESPGVPLLGVGTLFDAALRALGFLPVPLCTWVDMVRAMNRRGPDWCADNRALILSTVQTCASVPVDPVTAGNEFDRVLSEF